MIFNCVFNTGDDSVSIKSGKNPQGNEVNIPTKGVRVFDCRCTMGHGITIGSEMSGGVEDVKSGTAIWRQRCVVLRSRVQQSAADM